MIESKSNMCNLIKSHFPHCVFHNKYYLFFIQQSIDLLVHFYCSNCPGLVSTLPTISMNVNMKRRNTAFTFGFKLWRQRSAAKRNIILDKTISLCNLNIRSLRNKIDFLNDFAEDLDILLLTETHLDERIDECRLLLFAQNKFEFKSPTSTIFSLN
jgi:hypothetical protein